MDALVNGEYIVTLITLNRGAAVEVFQNELAKVLANIADPNTEASASREIDLKVKFKPSENRKEAEIEIESKVKLAQQRKARSRIFFGKVEGEPAAIQVDPNQGSLFDKPLTPGTNVSQFSGKGEVKPS